MVTLHPRETTSSGRPKPTHGPSEDDDYFYTYTRTGTVTSRPKTNIEHYAWWFKNNVKFEGGIRITPLTEFEKRLGVGKHISQYHYQGRLYNENEWTKFLTKFGKNKYGQADIDYGDLEIYDKPDIEKSWVQRAEEMDLIVVNLAQLEFKKKHPYCIANNIHGSNCDVVNTPELQLPEVEKIPPPARPNPKEVKKVEPVEVEPTKVVVKYSPLMIAGVIAVVVILFLRRRA